MAICQFMYPISLLFLNYRFLKHVNILAMPSGETYKVQYWNLSCVKSTFFKKRIIRNFLRIIWRPPSLNQLLQLYLEASEPKWVNPVLNLFGVNSLMLGGLHFINSRKCTCYRSRLHLLWNHFRWSIVRMIYSSVLLSKFSF